MSGAEHPNALPANQRFVTTHWSVVRAGSERDSPHAATAMEELCRCYWSPLYAYVRRHGHSVEDAEDLTQEFFARLIEKHWVAAADRSKGRFRTFLLTALNHFLANARRRSRTGKRDSGQPLISLDDTAEAHYALEAASDLTPEKLYEHRWVVNVFDRALHRLHAEYVRANKSPLYDRLKHFLSTQALDGEYDRVGKELAMSPGAVAAAVHRLRQHYRKLVRDEVAQTVESPEELEEEMRWLLNALN